MKVYQTSFAGVYLIEPSMFADPRGFFMAGSVLGSSQYPASIMVSATPAASVQGKRPQHGRTKAFEDSSFAPEWPIG